MPLRRHFARRAICAERVGQAVLVVGHRRRNVGLAGQVEVLVRDRGQARCAIVVVGHRRRDVGFDRPRRDRRRLPRPARTTSSASAPAARSGDISPDGRIAVPRSVGRSPTASASSAAVAAMSATPTASRSSSVTAVRSDARSSSSATATSADAPSWPSASATGSGDISPDGRIVPEGTPDESSAPSASSAGAASTSSPAGSDGPSAAGAGRSARSSWSAGRTDPRRPARSGHRRRDRTDRRRLRGARRGATGPTAAPRRQPGRPATRGPHSPSCSFVAGWGAPAYSSISRSSPAAEPPVQRTVSSPSACTCSKPTRFSR